MRAQGQATVWGNHIPVGGAERSSGWLQQWRDWWTLYKASRQNTKFESLNGCWDAHREVLIPAQADTAAEMAAAHGALSVATQLYGLSV